MSLNARADGDSHVALLEKFYEAEMRYVARGGAFEAAPFDEMAACFHPDAVMRQGPSAPFPGNWEGIAEVERFFAVLSHTWSRADGLDLKYFVGEDGVAVRMQVQLTSRTTGKQVDGLLAQFITFEDGLIRDFTVFYLDPVGISEACGL